jgi:hypothetical protein
MKYLLAICNGTLIERAAVGCSHVDDISAISCIKVRRHAAPLLCQPPIF